jgi:hypothetical protein
MNTTTVGLIFCAILLVGCDSTPATAPHLTYVKPGLILVPADQLSAFGRTVNSPGEPAANHGPEGPLDVRSVQTEASVSAIQFNRYADPARPDQLLHEAHIVYRREGNPRWKLQAASGEQQILIGPQLGDGRGEIRPLASQELDSFLREERTNLARQQEAMAKLGERLQQLGEQQQKISHELGEIKSASAPVASAPLSSLPRPPEPVLPSRPPTP